jgi:hypothetical protein
VTVPLETRKASLDRDWQPLTNKHEEELERAENTIAEFGRGGVVDPIAIVGAYRSGKTQLLYHLFETAWEREIPAFYISDPGEMIASFASEDETDLNEWIRSEINDQLEAYDAGRPKDVRWFPNVSAQRKEDFVSEHGGDIDIDETVRTALLFDEVEQSYQDFIQVLDKDDKNPLRKINDGLQDTVKIWSFGMISAFEFIGEADWGRMREVRIPPLEVSDIRKLLDQERPDLVELDNVLWWLARGRTGLIIKLIDQLPDDTEEEAVNWLRGLAETNFRETSLINNRWVNLDSENWEPAIRALLFMKDGLDEWQITDDRGLTVTQCSELAIDIIKEEYEFEDSKIHQSALEILDRNFERVFSGLAVTDSALFPTFGLADQDQGEALLSLVSDIIVSFEPAAPARTVAIEAIDTVKGSFHYRWGNLAYSKDSRFSTVTTAAPTVVKSAFPPIAVNPERISEGTTEDLREKMDRGISVDTASGNSHKVRVVFCPSIETFEAEKTEVVQSYDITTPTVLVIPEGRDFETESTEADLYQRHDLLDIQTHQSNRFWTFVVHLFDQMEEMSTITNPYRVTPGKMTEVIEARTDREIRNTIETLYDQLRQVNVNLGRALEDRYREAYSLPDSEELLWNESRLDGMNPYWSSGKFVESTVALSYLLVLSPDYETDREYWSIHESLAQGVDDELVPAGSSGFQFKSYLDNSFTRNGFSNAVSTERAHYRIDGRLAPAVRQLRNALSDLVSHAGSTDVIKQIDDPEVSIGDKDLPVVPDDLTHLGYALLRAILVSGLVDQETPEIDIVRRLQEIENRVDDQIDTLYQSQNDVRTLDDRFESPKASDVDNWISLDTDQLDEYEENLVTLREGVRDLISKVSSDFSAGSVGYHYWFLLDAYLETLRPEVTDFVSDIPKEEDVASTKKAVRLYDECYYKISNDDFVENVFEDRESLVNLLEQYGRDAFDLGEHLKSVGVALSVTPDAKLQQMGPGDESILENPQTDIETLYLPEQMNALRALNSEMSDHKSTLESLETKLEDVESNSKAIDDAVARNRDKLAKLLTPPESMEVSDE